MPSARRKKTRRPLYAAQDFVEDAAPVVVLVVSLAFLLPVMFPILVLPPPLAIPSALVLSQQSCAPPVLPDSCVFFDLDAPPIALACAAMYDQLMNPYDWVKRYYAV